MSGWVRVLRVALICVALVTIYFVLPLDTQTGDLARRAVSTVITVIVLVALLVWQLWFVEHGRGDGRIDGLIIAILGIVVGFSLACYVLQLQDPSQFVGMHTRLDALYFMATTVTTTGFGDVSAAGQTARGMVLGMMLVNVVLLATAASLLTSRLRERISQSRRVQAAPPPEQD